MCQYHKSIWFLNVTVSIKSQHWFPNLDIQSLKVRLNVSQNISIHVPYSKKTRTNTDFSLFYHFLSRMLFLKIRQYKSGNILTFEISEYNYGFLQTWLPIDVNLPSAGCDTAPAI